MTDPSTIKTLAERHLGRFLPHLDIRQDVTDTEHDTDVPCLVFNEAFVLSPYKHWQRAITGPVLTTAWLVERLEDDSDPSVGLFGYEPVEHKRCRTVGEALTEIGAELARLEIENSLTAEAEAQEQAEYEAVQAAQGV